MNNKGKTFPEKMKEKFLAVATSIDGDLNWGSDETIEVFYNPDFGAVKTRAHGIAYRTKGGTIQIVLGKMNIHRGLFRSIVAEEIFHAADFTQGSLHRGMSQVDAWRGEVRAQNFVLNHRSQIDFSGRRASQLRGYLSDQDMRGQASHCSWFGDRWRHY